MRSSRVWKKIRRRTLGALIFTPPQLDIPHKACNTVINQLIFLFRDAAMSELQLSPTLRELQSYVEKIEQKSKKRTWSSAMMFAFCLLTGTHLHGMHETKAKPKTIIGIEHVLPYYNPKTQSLNLSNQNIIKIEDEAFAEIASFLPDLRAIYLENNPLTRISPSIGRLKNLEKLYLSHTRIKELPKNIARLQHLRVLRAEDTKLCALPAGIGRLKNLLCLWISGTRVSELPPEFCQLTQLIELKLEGCPIKALPLEISKMSNLQTINLDGSDLDCIPVTLKDLPGLNFLSLSHTPLKRNVAWPLICSLLREMSPALDIAF